MGHTAMPNIATKASMLGHRGNSMLSIIARRWLNCITTSVVPLRRMDGYGIDLRDIKIHNDRESPTGVYIPNDLEETLRELETILPADLKQKMRGYDESEMNKFQMSLGVWLRDKWGLWTNSRLAKFFNESGVDDPDHMSEIILGSFWRYLHYNPIDLANQIRAVRRRASPR